MIRLYQLSFIASVCGLLGAFIATARLDQIGIFQNMFLCALNGIYYFANWSEEDGCLGHLDEKHSKDGGK